MRINMILIIYSIFRGAPYEMAIDDKCKTLSCAFYWYSDHLKMLAKTSVKRQNLDQNLEIQNLKKSYSENKERNKENSKLKMKIKKLKISRSSRFKITIFQTVLGMSVLLQILAETSLASLDVASLRPAANSSDLSSWASLGSDFIIIDGGDISQLRLEGTPSSLSAIILMRHHSFTLPVSLSGYLALGGTLCLSGLDVIIALVSTGLPLAASLRSNLDLRLAYKALGLGAGVVSLSINLGLGHSFNLLSLDVRDLGRCKEVVLHTSIHGYSWRNARGVVTLSPGTSFGPSSSLTIPWPDDSDVVQNSDLNTRCVIHANAICQIYISHIYQMIYDASLDMTDHRNHMVHIYMKTPLIYPVQSKPTPTHIVEGVVDP